MLCDWFSASQNFNSNMRLWTCRYHSESGWQTLLEIIVEHYGLEVDQATVTIFICLVPVIIDACVKLWVCSRLDYFEQFYVFLLIFMRVSLQFPHHIVIPCHCAPQHCKGTEVLFHQNNKYMSMWTCVCVSLL
jgi:hypothetical protein